MTKFRSEKKHLNKGWKAKLQLGFTELNGKTILNRKKHEGPLRVQKPFYPERNGTCHVYLLHPPGGVVGGDRLEVQVELEKGANGLFTTPAAGKFYRSSGSSAFQVQMIKVEDNACLEWFPLENIFFSGAKAKIKTRIEINPSSHFIGWDICCLGRPASNEPFIHGSLDQRFEIWMKEKPVRLERLLVQGNDPILSNKWGLDRKTVLGNLVCFTPEKELVDTLREYVKSFKTKDDYSVTFVNGVIQFRCLGNSADQVRKFLTRVWQKLRFEIRGHHAVIPRIWNT